MPSYSSKLFAQQLEEQIEATVTRTVRKTKIAAVRKTYIVIQQMWPVDTFWSKANNRISITGRPITQVEPRTRPEESGALADKARAVTVDQLTKLESIKAEHKSRSIIIGNAVPYAFDVGFEAGRGAFIYGIAAAQGKAEAIATIRSFTREGEKK
jgi:hypothetical protein